MRKATIGNSLIPAINFIRKVIFFLVIASSCFATDIPDYYSEPGINPYRSYINQDFGETIDPFTGKLQLHYADVYIPGNGGFDIKIQRSYTSLDEDLPSTVNTSIIGMGWEMAFGLMTKPKNPASCTNYTEDTNDNPVMTLADGSREVFAAPSQGSSVFGGNVPDYISKNRWIAYCKDTSTGLQWTVYSPDGTQYELSKTITSSTHNISAVRKITDTNGNSLSFEYYGDNDLYSAYNVKPFVQRITASDNREISFDYYDSASEPYNTMRLRSITANGQTTTYNYQQVGPTNLYRLTGVDLPGNNTGSWGYHYIVNDSDLAEDATGRFSIDRVTYPYGGVIQYTYTRNYFVQNNGKLSNGVDTKRTYDGSKLVGEWVYEYKPGYVSYLPNQLDQTKVTMPGSTVIYQHIGLQSAGQDEAWKIGLLKKKIICEAGLSCSESVATQAEIYTWDYQTVSGENFAGPRSRVDPDLRQPILVNKVVTRDGSSYETSYSDFDNYGNAKRVEESGNGNRTTLYSFYRNNLNWIVNQVEDETVLEAATIDGSVVDATIDRELDAKGNLRSENTYGVQTQYTYYNNGNLETTTNARQKTTHFKDDYYRGIARQEERPEDVIIKRVVNPTGTLESETNGRGFTTSFSYDSLNRLAGIDYPIHSDVTIVRTPNSRVLGRGSYRETVKYDGFGRAISDSKEDVSRGIAIVTTTRYDALGRTVFKSYPNSTEGTDLAYDSLGRATKVTHVDGSTIINTYLSNNRTQTKDERDKITLRQYRSYGDPDSNVLVRVDAPEDVIVTIGRDKLGNITQVWRGNSAGTGSTREYIYNSKFFVKQENNPETGPTFYGRDENGNMTSRQVGANGAVTIYIYDDLDRLKQIDYPAPTPDVNYVYDKNDNAKEVTNHTSKRVYKYDENDNLKKEDILIDGSLYTVKYDYDAHDYLGAITYPTGRIANYQPDALGRPTKVEPILNSVTYYPSGQPHILTYSNGHSMEYTLTSRRWIHGIRDSGATNAVALTYGYDYAGNVSGITNTLAPSYSRSMQYDDLNRLDYAEGNWGIEDYDYTEIGDIKSINYGGANDKVFKYVDNKLDNVIQGTETESFSYDDYGNITGNGSYNFFYNDAQQLELATPKSIGGSFSFEYDGNDMRVVRDKDGQRKKFVYLSSGLLLGEYPAELTKGEEYYYLGTQRVATAKVANTVHADAGADMTVNEGDTVSLDASGSFVYGVPADVYIWEQISGPEVILQNHETAVATFVAPSGHPDYQLGFRLKAGSTIYHVGDTDSVIVNVKMIDTDSDGLSDLWETNYYGGLTAVDANTDTDGDGLSAAEEFLSNTDPTVQTAPEPAERLRAVPGNAETVVTWMKAEYADSYDLYWSTSPNVSTQTGNKVENVTSPFIHGGLENGTRYYYVVVAKNGCCETVSREASIVPGVSGWTTPSVITTTTRNLFSSGNYIDKEFKATLFNRGTADAVESYIAAESYSQFEGWREPVVIKTAGEGDYDWWSPKPDLTMGANGSAIAVWKQDGTLVARHYTKASGWGNQYSWTLGVGSRDISEFRVVTQQNGDATLLVRLHDANEATTYYYAIDYSPQTEWSNAQLIETTTGQSSSMQEVVISETGYMALFFYDGEIGRAGNGSLIMLKRSPAKDWGERVFISNHGWMGRGYASISNSGQVAAAYKKTIYDDYDYQDRLFLWREDKDTGQSVNELISEDEVFAIDEREDPGHAQLVQDDQGRITIAWSPPLSSGGLRSIIESSVGRIIEDCFVHPEVAYRIYYKMYNPTSGWSEQKQIKAPIPAELNCASMQPNYELTQDASGDVHFIVSASAGFAAGAAVWCDEGSVQKAALDYKIKYKEGERYPISIYPWYTSEDLGQDDSQIAYSDKSDNVIAVIREDNFSWNDSHPAVAEYVNIEDSPIANAGENIEVYPQDSIVLDGSHSTSLSSNITAYIWSQIAGSTVTLSGADTATPAFESPDVQQKQTLWFELTVTDANGLSDKDSVGVTVYPVTSNLVADAGSDIVVLEGSTVTLDGTNTQDPNDIVWKAHWIQTNLPVVQLDNPSGQDYDKIQWLAEFVAPDVEEDMELTFKLRVEDTARRVVYAYKKVTVKNNTGSTDLVQPVVTPPADIGMEATDILTPVNLGEATAVDDRDGSLTPQPDRTGPFSIGVHTITWSATDTAGNTGTATQTVEIRDTTKPTLDPPRYIMALSNVPIAIEIGMATADDIFTPVVITNDAPTEFPVGETTVTWTATDKNGNAATASQLVDVREPTLDNIVAYLWYELWKKLIGG